MPLLLLNFSNLWKKLVKNPKYNLTEIAEKYGIEYDGKNKEKFVYELALAGKSFISDGQIKETEQIIDILFKLGKMWKDNLTWVKAYLLLSEVEMVQGKDNFHNLKKAIKHAKKLENKDILSSIYGQLAFDYFIKKEYKNALKILDKVELGYATPYELQLLVAELKARSYWALDDFEKGFDATFEWFSLLAETYSDIPSIFMSIVYLLTVKGSIELSLSDIQLQTIENTIYHVLQDLATQTNLFPNILINLDLLFAKPLMLTDSKLLFDFAESLLKNAEWYNQDYYLPFAKKLTELFYHLNEFEKANNILEKGITFASHRNYKHIIQQLKLLQIEVKSLVFYFQELDPLLDPHSISEVLLKNENETIKKHLKLIDLPRCSFPATSYSNFMRILERAAQKPNLEHKKFEIIGFPRDLQRTFLVLQLEIANQQVVLLLKEDFHVHPEETTSLHTTILPFYAVIGILLDDESSEDIYLKELENALLLFQRAMHCPSSKINLYWPEEGAQFNLCKCWLMDSSFKKTKQKLLESTINLKNKYPILKNKEFLNIFKSDPITIFDLALRDEDRLYSFRVLIEEAYNITFTEEQLHDLLSEIITQFLSQLQNRDGQQLFYNYAWLYYTSKLEKALNDDNYLEQRELCKKLSLIVEKTKDRNKYLMYLYLENLTNFKHVEKDKTKSIKNFIRYAKEVGNKEFILIAEILEFLSSLNQISTTKEFNELLSQISKLWQYKDKKKIDQLIEIVISKIENEQTIVQSVNGLTYSISYFYPLLVIAKHLLENGKYKEAFSISRKLRKAVFDKGTTDTMRSHQATYIKIQSALLCYQTLKNQGLLDTEEGKMLFNEIGAEIANHPEWIGDYKLLLEILIDRTRQSINSGEFGIAKKYLHLLEEYVFYELEIILKKQELSILSALHEFKQQISKEHFT